MDFEQKDLSEGCPTIFLGVCPLNYIGGLSNNISRSMSIKLYFGGLSNIYLIFEECPMSFKNKKFLFSKTYFIHGKCMCEGVGEDSKHGEWHVDIHVEICIFFLQCVWMCENGIACALRWVVALVGDFLYWALLTQSWEKKCFQVLGVHSEVEIPEILV